MGTQRILVISALAATLGGCSAYAPYQQADTNWDNVWRPNMQPRQVAQQPVVQQQVAHQAIYQPGYQATFEQRTMPGAVSRGYVQAPRQMVSSSRQLVPQATISARPAMPRAETFQSVASAKSTDSCAVQRDEFGLGMQTQLDEFIRLQIAQAEALSEADLDVTTKSRLLLELSSSVQRMMQKSKGLDFFRAGLYGLCQAHSIGAMNKATYSAKFERLMQTASESIRLEDTNAGLQFSYREDPAAHQVGMHRR